MKIFDAGIANVVIRFYLMMAYVLVVVFLDQYWLLPVGVLIFLYAMLGVSLKKKGN